MLWSIQRAMAHDGGDIDERQLAYANWEKSNARNADTRNTRCTGLRDVSHACIGSIPAGYSRRQRCSIILATSPLGRTWDLLQTFLSVIACVFYVLETYNVTVTKVNCQRCLAKSHGVTHECSPFSAPSTDR